MFVDLTVKRELERIGDNVLEITSLSIQKYVCGIYFKKFLEMIFPSKQ